MRYLIAMIGGCLLAMVMAGCDKSEPAVKVTPVSSHSESPDDGQLRAERDQLRAERDSLTKMLAETYTRVEQQRTAYIQQRDSEIKQLIELYNAMNQRVTALEPKKPKLPESVKE